MYIWVQYSSAAHIPISLPISWLEQASMHLVSDTVRLCTLEETNRTYNTQQINSPFIFQVSQNT